MAINENGAYEGWFQQPDQNSQPSAFDTTQPGQPAGALDGPWTPPAADNTPQASAPAAPGPAATPQPSAAPRAAQVMETLGVAPPTGSASAPATSSYASSLQDVQNASDPASLMAAQDKLAREVSATLTTAGHEVSWDGLNLMVDGRPYEVGSSLTANAAPAGPTPPAYQHLPTDKDIIQAYATSMPTHGPVTEADLMSWRGNANFAAEIAGSPEGLAYGVGQPYTRQYDGMPGFDTAKLNDPNKHDPKYDFARVVQQHPELLQAGNLGQLVAFYNATTGGKATVTDGDKVDFGDGIGPVDVIKDSHTDHPTLWWGPVGNGASAPGTAAPAAGAPTGGSSVLNTNWSGTPLGGSAATPAYTPGQFGEIDPRVESLIQQLSEHPTSMDAHTVEELKAKDAEEQMAAAQSSDEASRRFGFQGGIIDSPWLASERAATARGFDQSIISNRRNIDIQAAQTNTNDLRASIGTLTSVWSQQKDAFALNEQLKLEAAKLGLSREQFLQQLQVRLMELEQQDKEFGANLAFDYDQLNNSAYNSWAG